MTQTGSRILIAEDNVVLSIMLKRQLEGAGFQVAVASRESEALALARRRQIDLALVDIDLDAGDSGITLARLLRDDLAVSSVFLTGRKSAALENADAALAVIVKPVAMDDIVGAVETLLHSLETGSKADRHRCVIWLQGH